MQKPNTFIIGAPKCGTTSLAAWLAEHPQVFMTNPKEPYFFCRPTLQLAGISSFEGYHALFEQANYEHRVIAEATTAYLYDDTALTRLLDYQPEARLVVMLRNPVDLAISWHAESVRQLRETETQFDMAWRLRGERRRGFKIPSRCSDPLLLDYEAVGSLGSQLARVLKMTEACNVHVVFLDDIRKEPRKAWTELLNFLGLDDDGRNAFPVYNVGFMPTRFKLYSCLMLTSRFVKKCLRLHYTTGFVAKIAKRVTVLPGPPSATVSKSTYTDMRNAFREEVKLLEKLTGRDLSDWLSRGNS